MTILQAIILGVVQGIGEFLPISSSAHLIIVPWLFGWQPSGLAFDLAVHVGTTVAIAAYFWRDLLNLAHEGLTRGLQTPMGRIAWGIVLGTIPGVSVGFLLKDFIELVVRENLVIIALALAVMGVVLYFVDRNGKKNRTLEHVTLRDVFWIGVGQAFALLPGVSRSGATITTALLRGLDRETSARISFWLAFPITLGGAVLALKDMTFAELTPAFWTGVTVSALAGYGVIAFLMDFLRRGTFLLFAQYRVALAAVVLFLYALRLG